MSDKIVRTSVEENEEKIIKKQVMNKTDDKLIRHQVMGIEEPIPEPVLVTLNVTENGTYTPEVGEDGFNEVVVNVSNVLPMPNSINIVGSLPSQPVEGAMYLIPQTRQYIPSFPLDSGYSKFIVTCDVQNALQNENYKSATEFYLLCGDYLKTSATSDQILNYVNDYSNEYKYPKIYKYVVGGNFEWVDISASVPNVWGTDVYPSHQIQNVIYASENITSWFDTLVYQPTSNVINSDGSLIDDDVMALTYDTYIINNGVAVQGDTSNLLYLLTNLFNIIKPLSITENGTYTPDNRTEFGYGPVTVNVE